MMQVVNFQLCGMFRWLGNAKSTHLSVCTISGQCRAVLLRLVVTLREVAGEPSCVKLDLHREFNYLRKSLLATFMTMQQYILLCIVSLADTLKHAVCIRQITANK